MKKLVLFKNKYANSLQDLSHDLSGDSHKLSSPLAESHFKSKGILVLYSYMYMTKKIMKNISN